MSLRATGPETSVASTGLHLAIVVSRDWTHVLSRFPLLPPLQFWLHGRGAGEIQWAHYWGQLSQQPKTPLVGARGMGCLQTKGGVSQGSKTDYIY